MITHLHTTIAVTGSPAAVEEAVEQMLESYELLGQTLRADPYDDDGYVEIVTPEGWIRVHHDPADAIERFFAGHFEYWASAEGFEAAQSRDANDLYWLVNRIGDAVVEVFEYTGDCDDLDNAIYAYLRSLR